MLTCPEKDGNPILRPVVKKSVPAPVAKRSGTKLYDYLASEKEQESCHTLELLEKIKLPSALHILSHGCSNK